MNKYNLFCGDEILPGYLNVDKFNEKANLVCDVMQLSGENIADEVRMNHGLEHLDFKSGEELIKKLYRMLAFGGKLILVHPDASAAAVGLAKGTINARKFEMLIWGYQSNEGEYHYSGYTPETMKRLLEEAGFKRIRITHPRRFYEMKVVARKGNHNG